MDPGFQSKLHRRCRPGSVSVPFHRSPVYLVSACVRQWLPVLHHHPCGWIAHQFRLVHIITSDCYCGTVSVYSSSAPPLLSLYVAGIAWAQGLTHIIPTWIQSPDAIPPTNFHCDNIAGVNIISEIKFFVSALCLSWGGGICVSGEICLELSCTQNTRLITFHLHNIG